MQTEAIQNFETLKKVRKIGTNNALVIVYVA